jgi:hypothetical protein
MESKQRGALFNHETKDQVGNVAFAAHRSLKLSPKDVNQVMLFEWSRISHTVRFRVHRAGKSASKPPRRDPTVHDANR